MSGPATGPALGPAIIVHGGAEPIPPEKAGAFRAGVRRALEAGWGVLERGGLAADAVEAAVRVMEDDPTFNAGYGSTLNPRGQVEMDAGIMEGTGLNVGAVGAIQRVRHPISVARRLMDEPTVLLVGPGAKVYADSRGLEAADGDALISPEQRQKWEQEQGERNDTVGCVALDRAGRLAAGCSTGGIGGRPPGRVGDSAAAGAGFYADDAVGACAITGEGEQILRVTLARVALHQLERHPPDEAVAQALRVMSRVGGEAGIILIDRRGRFGWNHLGPNMSCAYRSASMAEPKVYLAKAEEGEERDV